MDVLLLLHDEQQPVLQHGEVVVDGINGGRDREGNDPPIVFVMWAGC